MKALLRALICLLLWPAAMAAGEAAHHVGIDGPREAQVGDEVALRAVAVPEPGAPDVGPTRIEWTLNGRLVQTGATLKCHSDRRGAWKLTASLVAGEWENKQVIASAHHVLVFLPPDPTLQRLAAAPKPKVPPVTVALAADRTSGLPGDSLKLTALVTGGKSPYLLSWVGDPSLASQKTATVTLALKKPGEQRVSVVATDALGQMHSTHLSITTATCGVKLTNEVPGGESLMAGERVTLRADAFADGKPIEGRHRFRWTSEPPAEWAPADPDAHKVTARLTKPGTVRVRAEAVREIEGESTALAQSEDLPLKIMLPRAQLAVEPSYPYVGQQTAGRIVLTPDIPEAQVRWSPLPPSVKLLSRSPDQREFSFFLTDDLPVQLKAEVVLPPDNTILGEIKKNMSARQYAMRVTGPKAAGPRAKIWKQGVGLVELDRGWAVNEAVTFGAVVSSAADLGTLRYDWKADSASCRIEPGASGEAKVTCSGVGDYTLRAAAIDSHDVVLGTAATVFSVTVSQAELDNAAKQAEAARLREDAFDLLQQDKLEDAIHKYKESLNTWSNRELAVHVTMLERELLKRSLDQARLIQLRKEGADLDQQGDIEGAIAKYRECLEIGPNAELDREIARLEKKITDQEARKAQAAALKEEGRRLEKEGLVAEALAKYDQSLSTWPDTALEWHAQNLQQTIAERNAKREKADQLAHEAALLEQQGKPGAAAAKYDESLALAPNEQIAAHAAELKSELVRQAAKRSQAAQLGEEAAALEREDRLAEAAAKCRESLALRPDPEVQSRLSGLEQKLADRQQRKDQAAQLCATALAMEQKNDLTNAIAHYRMSLDLEPDAEVQRHVAALESAVKAQAGIRARADQAKSEAEAFEQQGRLRDAIARYMEALSIRPDEDVKKRLEDLQVRLTEEITRKATAAALRKEATVRLDEGDVPGAIGKFKESLAAYPDPETEKQVQTLEAEQASREAAEKAALEAAEQAAAEAAEQAAALAAEKAAAEAAQKAAAEAAEQIASEIAEKTAQPIEKPIETAAPAPTPAPAPESVPEPAPAPALEEPELALAEPEPAAPAGGSPDLAGTTWQGVILIGSGANSTQWPLRFTVDRHYSIISSYQANDPLTGQPANFTALGDYSPESGSFELSFRGAQGGVTNWVELSGSANSPEAAGGRAELTSASGAKQGIWRAIRSE